MIASGARPSYRLQADQDGRYAIYGCPRPTVAATTRRAALDAARLTIAQWLDVGPDAFDVEV
jgi:hypothetical protein